MDLRQAQVGWYGISGFKQNDITRNKILSADILFDPVADHPHTHTPTLTDGEGPTWFTAPEEVNP